MRQRIFDLRLGLHATSLYLLMESLGAMDKAVERQTVEDLWNAASSELDQALDELAGRGVIAREEGLMRIQPPQAWS